MKQALLEIGTIVGTHGLKGELRVQPACDSPAFFGGFPVLYLDSKGEQPVRVTACRAHKHLALLCLEGVETVEQAQALLRRRLYFRRADARLEPGQYFIAELLGCEVLDANNPALCYGTLCDVSKTGANDVWHIRRPGGGELLIPLIDEVVRRVEIEENKVWITPLEGLL
ncbi:MAG: ribosome maturation factor RimM [Oscillospiraceae bacterium]|jgi:16S rRNA processing protein RimM|nr:ribosome maturation factor RimM [Oscillospiraceae bacterium]